jgi:hypothetical protein
MDAIHSLTRPCSINAIIDIYGCNTLPLIDDDCVESKVKAFHRVGFMVEIVMQF